MAHTGVSMRLDVARVRFARRQGPGGNCPEKLTDRILEIRMLLRSDSTAKQIAESLGVTPRTLYNFCRKRNICDLTARQKMIRLSRL